MLMLAIFLILILSGLTLPSTAKLCFDSTSSSLYSTVPSCVYTRRDAKRSYRYEQELPLREGELPLRAGVTATSETYRYEQKLPLRTRVTATSRSYRYGQEFLLRAGVTATSESYLYEQEVPLEKHELPL